MSEMNILPPENNVFDKKFVSNKQKEHLIKARAAAKATVERRRKLDAEQKEIDKKQEEHDVPVVNEEQEDVEEESPSVEQNVQLKIKKTPTVSKKKVMTEEEKETHRFQKFMKNMSQWETFKKEEEERIEESKKIKVSFTPEEYDHIDFLLKREGEARERNEAEKLQSQKPVPVSKPRIMTSQKYTNNRIAGNKLNRFGNS